MRSRDGTLNLVVREGSGGPDPGVGEGVHFDFTTALAISPFMNAFGEIVFGANLVGSGITTANNTGIWVWNKGELLKVVRNGDAFDVNPDPLVDDMRTISGIGDIRSNRNGSGGGDGRQTLLNDRGLIAFNLNFTDGSSGIFTAQLPRESGDFDNDGDVDGADFIAWQTNFPMNGGAALADGDADGDGDVDGADLGVWQTNFGASPGGGSSTVPEPGAGLLGLFASAGMFFFRRFTLPARL